MAASASMRVCAKSSEEANFDSKPAIPVTESCLSLRRVLLLHSEAASAQKLFWENAVPFLTPQHFSRFQPLLKERARDQLIGEELEQ